MAKEATRNAYGKALAELVKERDDVLVLDADLTKSTKTIDAKKARPEHHFNMGIAEGNMMAVAAGMAASNKVVYASSFAMFAAGRAFEQIRNSICYPNLLPDIGYETGLTILHYMGLTSQMPRERVLVTNVAKECMRTDKKLGVVIRPPKTPVTAENKNYLQLLDTLELLKKAPVDVEHPYEIIAEHIQRKGLQYKTLLAIADQYYNRNTILNLAHTASMKGNAL